MLVAKIRIVNNIITVTDRQKLTSGSVGDTVSLEFGEGWAGLTKHIVFRSSDTEYPVLNPAPVQEIPCIVLSNGGRYLEVGAYGENANGERIITTEYVQIGYIYQGTRIQERCEPYPGWGSEIEQKVIGAVDTAESVRRDADAGMFDGADGFSPVAAVTDVPGGAKVTVTDKNGTTEQIIHDGKDGKDAPLQVFTATITSEVGRYVCDMTSSEIIDKSRNGIVRAVFTDSDSGETRVYRYAKQTADRRAVFSASGYIEDGESHQTLIYVDYAGNVTVKTRTPDTVTCYATCTAPSAPPTTTPVTWYVPKTMPRPSGNPGMLIDVFWVNGRASGLGYDITLVWGEEGGADNEVIVTTASTTDSLTGTHGIPTEGTVRYQLEEVNGRKRWRYVSGPLLAPQFSTDTAADVADKSVPGMSIAYLPGMEIYVQLDQGNTAEVMRLAPDEGQSLPVYGNGTGATTGKIKPGTILHLKNAGDHWQIINSSGDAIDDTQTSADTTWSSQKISDEVDKKTDISLGLTSVSPGDLIKVKSVDSAGVPTAWEKTSLEELEGQFELVAETTTDGTSTIYEFDIPESSSIRIITSANTDTKARYYIAEASFEKSEVIGYRNYIASGIRFSSTEEKKYITFLDIYNKNKQWTGMGMGGLSVAVPNTYGGLQGASIGISVAKIPFLKFVRLITYGDIFPSGVKIKIYSVRRN